MTPQSSRAGADRSSTMVVSLPAPDTQTKSADGVWSDVEQSGMANVQPERPDIRSFRSVALNQNALEAILNAAPMEFSEAAAAQRLILTLPRPNGTFARFSIAESPIMQLHQRRDGEGFHLVR